jgi:hypothetical protein
MLSGTGIIRFRTMFLKKMRFLRYKTFSGNQLWQNGMPVQNFYNFIDITSNSTLKQ